MGNIGSRVSPFCILQAAIISGTVQSNFALAFFLVFFLKQLTLLAAGAIASRISGLSVVSPQVQRCLEINILARVELLPVTSRSIVQTDNYNFVILYTTKNIFQSNNFLII